MRLSICIPTFERPGELDSCLHSISEHSDEILQNVEIIVSDNNSACRNDYDVVISKYSRLNIKYSRRETNIGAERNIRFLIMQAEGDYLWILGDDDAVQGGGLEAILERLKKNIDVLILNHNLVDKSMSRIVRKDAFEFFKGRAGKDKSTILQDFGPLLGLTSATIVRRNSFRKIVQTNYDKFIDYGFPYLYCLYILISTDCLVDFCSEIVMLNRVNNSGGYDWNKYFISGLPIIFDDLRKFGYSVSSIDSAIRKLVHKYIAWDLLISKRDRVSIKSKFFLSINSFRNRPYCLIVIAIAASIPGSALRIIYKLKTNFNA